MAGTCRLLQNGKYELCISLKSDITGKRIRKYKYVEASGNKDLQKKLAEFVAELNGQKNKGTPIIGMPQKGLSIFQDNKLF